MILSDSLLGGLLAALRYWWAYVPIIMSIATYQMWMMYQRRKYLLGLDWVLIEIIPPPDVPKSPKLAESIFAGLHGIYGVGLAWKKMFLFGTVPDWFSFETVSHGGEIHFLVRTTEKLRNVVEANIFAQYPDAEIRLVEDYIELLPDNLPEDEEYSFFGTDLVFTKDHPYPIKTWREFEEAGGRDEHSRIDPIAPLMETMSDLRPGEFIWIHYMMRPTGSDWIKEGKVVVDKLKGKKEEDPFDPVLGVLGFFGGMFESVLAAFGAIEPPEEKREEKKDDFSLQKLSPAEKMVLENVEYKLAKLAFKAGIRILYAGRKDVFMASRVSGVTGMFKQLYFNNLNSFKPNLKTWTRDKGVMSWMFKDDKGFFADSATARRKKLFWRAFREREFMPDYTIMNVEELATLWHLPGINVQAPLIPRVQAKKGQPPSFLPTE